jgi:hypothetical protein
MQILPMPGWRSYGVCGNIKKPKVAIEETILLKKERILLACFLSAYLLAKTTGSTLSKNPRVNY